MNYKPTGRLEGSDLVLTRTFRAPIDDVWTSITSSESTARWFGPWERAPGGDDKKIRVQMAFEEGKPWMDGVIETCERPAHLAIRTVDSSGQWHLEMKLAETGGITTLQLIHKNVDKKQMGSVGPGWEYYLENLVASREGRTLPKFDEFYPSQKEYFAALDQG